MMNPVFSFHSFGGRRFLVLILLLINIHIMQAVCRDNEPLSSSIPSSSAQFVISEGTLISGLEQIQIPNQNKEKIKKTFKRRSRPISCKRKHKKEHHPSEGDESGDKVPSIFIGNTPSGTSLLLASHSNQQLIIPSQHTISYLLLWAESPTIVLHYLLDLLLNKTHKDGWHSYLRFFRKLSRPPPFINEVITSFFR
ncbi:hypothetical protein [Chryseobacterium sp. JK1]|uniref:hypothetical protein n=1 Tax=Chryseobacterium sp. JK1 TaxID=874294 RepID=UPI003D6961F9